MTTLPGNSDAGDIGLGPRNVGTPGARPDTAELEEVDPFIAERIVAIRNRYGIDGLRQAERMIRLELAIFADSARELSADS